MNNVKIAEAISSSIKEKKWLSIGYHNKENLDTYYWCSIKDIIINTKDLVIDMFNIHKSQNTAQTTISFDRIFEAKVIEGTNYEVPVNLIKKIKENLNQLDWLYFDGYNDSILKYLEECYRYDNDPYQDDYNLVTGIDLDVLVKFSEYKLRPIQFGEIVEKITGFIDNDNKRMNFKEFAVNVLSIFTTGKLYVVAYKKVYLDIKNQTLRLAKEILFNKSFLINNNKVSLGKYIEIDPNDFCMNFSNNIEEYKELIDYNKFEGESLDEKPYLMVLRRDLLVNLKDTYNAISEFKSKNSLSIPLESFFGNVSERNIGKESMQICFKDDKFNIDQLRVVFSTLKNPVTYVQGPPGTGKTATIINIILSLFINGKSALICSNNNKPVDEIFHKVKFIHKGNEVPFPILRLGNMDYNLSCLNRIKHLYDKSKDISIIDNSLNRSKNNITKNFNSLNNLLESYEKKMNIEEKTSSLRALHKVAKDKRLLDTITIELQKLDREYQELPTNIDAELEKRKEKNTFIAENDFHFMQYLYYKSFEYIKKLDDNKYQWLFDIIKLPEATEEEKINKNREFNSALGDSIKFSMLIEAFPFIAVTNLSSNKLGSPYPYFDHCIMDEAGQCNLATSLIPIIRGKNLVMIGDQNQLQPVIVLDNNINDRLMRRYKINDSYNYCTNSILTVMQEKDKVSQFILLRSHYRCGRKIIQYSNDRFYNGKLEIKTLLNNNQLEMYSVTTLPNQELRNTSYQEAIQIVDVIQKNNYKDVGIITPFRNQSILINQLLKERNMKNAEAGTIHTFQGNEKSVIMFSSAITQATGKKQYEWVSENKELINVAVTRAKDKLVVVGDYDTIMEKSGGKENDLTALLKHVKSNGSYKVEPSQGTEYLGLKMYDTKSESQFFETINHITTTVKDIEVKSKVKVSTVFTKANVSDKNLYYTGEFDFVIYDKKTKLPLLVFEIDGHEHINDPDAIRRDREKYEISGEKGIKVIKIENRNVRRYSIIKQLLLQNYR